MLRAKPALVTGAAILAIVAALFLWQRSKAADLRGRLAELGKRRDSAHATIDQFQQTRAILGDARPKGARTAKSLLAHAAGPLDAEAVFPALTELVTTRDVLGKLQILLPMANLSRSEYDKMLAMSQEFQGSAQIKESITSMLAMFAPDDNPSATLERLTKLGFAPRHYAKLLSKWAADDADAALAWFRTQRDSGSLEGKKIFGSPEETLFAGLLGGIAKGAPDKAVDLFLEMDTKVIGKKYQAVGELATGIASAMNGGGDDAQLRRLLAWDSEGNYSSTIVAAALESATEGKDFNDSVTFVESYIDDSFMRQDIITAHVFQQYDQPLENRVEKLASYLPEDKVPNAVSMLVATALAYGTEGATRKWASAQPPGLGRDQGWRAVSDRSKMRQDYETALADAGQIGDAQIRMRAEQGIARTWIRRDEEAARAGLPTELFESVKVAN